jgi:GT2 family glycosyltransferase
MKYSIIIPTYNRCEELLKPCIESLIAHTNLDEVEVIVVANGCTDNTAEFVINLGHPFRLISDSRPLGFTVATNLGIKIATGDYIVLLNNDTILLDWQQKSDWLRMLEEPLKNPDCMMSGPLELYDHDVQSPFIVFCLAMIKREAFDRYGILDEIFNPGYGEDIDFNMKIKRDGKTSVEVGRYTTAEGNPASNFPFWHKSTQTFGAIPEYGNSIVPRNQKILRDRYL